MKATRQNWKMEVQGDTVELYLYQEIEAGYYDWWEGAYVYGESSVDSFKEKLEAQPNAKQINVYINSNGGDVKEAYGMLSILERHPAQKHVFVDGFACSAASLFLCIADKVTMGKQAVVMLHNMWSTCIGNANDMRKMADDLDKLMEANRKLYLSRMNVTEEELIAILDNETYFTAEECLKNGLADEIAGETDLDEMSKINAIHETQLDRIMASRRQHEAMLKALNKEPVVVKPVQQEEKEDVEEEKQQTNSIFRILKALA